MVCPHLEQLARDIKSQGFTDMSNDQQPFQDTQGFECFDCYLDRKSIRQKHHFPDFIKDHLFQKNDDPPKEGFVCEQCNQSIIGLQARYVPGGKTFGYNDAGQAHVFYFEDIHTVADTLDQEEKEKPSKIPKKRPGLPSVIVAVFLSIPIAIYQYFPGNEELIGFIAGISTIMLAALILSPITQKIRGKERYSFPFVAIFIALLLSTPVFILFGWKAIYYALAGYAGLAFLGSILYRLIRRKKLSPR